MWHHQKLKKTWLPIEISVSTCRNQNIVSDTATCSDKSCVIKIYHLSCLGLEVQPKGKWLFVHNVQEKKLEERNQNKHF